MNKKMWIFTSAILAALLGSTALAEPPSTSAAAGPSREAQATRTEIEHMFGFIPGFLKTLPDSVLPGAWTEMKSLQMNPSTALPGKVKELIGLAVAAQIPCKYCTYAHTEFAKLNGASQQEIGEAVAMSALARHWSTFMNGVQLDEAKFKQEISEFVTRMKNQPASAAPPKPIEVVDAKSARADAQQTLGMVPEFLKKFPDVALAGAYREWRDVELSPTTAISGKNKSLISLAVASQIPCKYCIYADTEFAKLEGASQAEVDEAVAMASLVRHWSTVLNGMQTDEVAFRRDVDRLVRGAKAQQSKAEPHAEAATAKH